MIAINLKYLVIEYQLTTSIYISQIMQLTSCWIAFLWHAVIGLCNTEKVIFIAPPEIQIPTAHPTLEDLHLHALTPQLTTHRTHLEAAFPNATAQKGVATWLVLDKLQAGQRYEVRVCWAAIQPTAFNLDVFELEKVFSDAELITSLAKYSATRQPSPEEASVEAARRSASQEITSSILFLRILAAADYFTMNQSLMENVPPVYVDIILDPYLMNVFPKSLLPTAIYIIVVAIGAWFLSKAISSWMINISRQERLDQDKKDT